jgi:hypothetical protein
MENNKNVLYSEIISLASTKHKSSQLQATFSKAISKLL